VLLLRPGGIQNVWLETVTSAYGKVESKNVPHGHRVRISSVAQMNFYARLRGRKDLSEANRSHLFRIFLNESKMFCCIEGLRNHMEVVWSRTIV